MHTSDHEWPRVTTNGHEWPRVTTNGHQWPPVTTSDHKWPRVTTNNHVILIPDKYFNYFLIAVSYSHLWSLVRTLRHDHRFKSIFDTVPNIMQVQRRTSNEICFSHDDFDCHQRSLNYDFFYRSLSCYSLHYTPLGSTCCPTSSWKLHEKQRGGKLGSRSHTS